MKSLTFGRAAVLACMLAGWWCGCGKDSPASESDKLTKAFATSGSKPAAQPNELPPPPAADAPTAPVDPNQPAPDAPVAQVATQPLVKSAAEAIKKQQYEAAITNLHALTKASNLTPDQRGAVQETMAELQQRLIREMEAGDPKAKRAVEAMKRMIENQ